MHVTKVPFLLALSLSLSLSLSNIHNVGTRVCNGLFHNNNFLIAFSGVKSHTLLMIDRWKRFGAKIVRGLLLHTLGFEARENMFVVECPGSKELLSNWEKVPGAAGHQTLHRVTKNLISWSWNIP